MSVRDFLRNEFERRCKRNARYSLRSFARDIGFTAQRLSHVINGKRGLSRQAGLQLANKLALSQGEAEKFLEQLDSEFARSKTKRAAARDKVKLLASRHLSLDLDQFKIISDWYHLAILTLLDTDTPYRDEHAVARAISISVAEAKFALERLVRMGMASRDSSGRYRSLGTYYAGGSDIPNESLKQFHEQYLMRTHEAVRTVGVDERDLSVLFMAVDPSDVVEAKKMISDFRKKFDERFAGPGVKRKQVYAFGMQFYKVSHRETLKREKK